MDDELKRSLADYRAAQTPGAEGMARARAAVEERIALGDPGLDVPSDVLRGGGDSGNGSGSGATSGVLKLLGGALGIGLGALGVWGVTERGSEPGKAPVGASAPAADVTAQRMPPAEQTPTAASEPTTGDLAAASPIAPAAERPVRVAPSANGPHQPHPSAAASSGATESSGLREEMALLSRGQAALQAGDPAGALAAFDEHRRRFSTGALSAEREVKRMVALCQLGRAAEARAEAARFAKRHPGSPLSVHALKICEAKHE